MLNNYDEFIDFYFYDIQGTGYLAFRDLKKIINHHNGTNILDFGCGVGRSSTYLKRLGFTVTGVDISAKMIALASELLSDYSFYQIQNNQLPFPDRTFDHVFNSFVLFDMKTKDEIISAFYEMKRVCKKSGSVISVVNSDYLFIKNWLTVKNDFKQNKHLKSGDIAKLYLSDVNVEILDYYWTKEDYQDCFRRVGFKNIQVYEPLGRPNEPFTWLDELYFPPYSIYVCSF